MNIFPILLLAFLNQVNEEQAAQYAAQQKKQRKSALKTEDILWTAVECGPLIAFVCGAVIAHFYRKAKANNGRGKGRESL
jgi:hypothetical protein